MGPSDESAAVAAIAQLKSVDRDGERQEDRRAVDFRFAKRWGKWIITTVNVWAAGDVGP